MGNTRERERETEGGGERREGVDNLLFFYMFIIKVVWVLSNQLVFF